MKSLVQLARKAYIAKWLRTTGSTDEAAALRTWLALKFDEQEGWVAAVRSIQEDVKQLH